MESGEHHVLHALREGELLERVSCSRLTAGPSWTPCGTTALWDPSRIGADLGTGRRSTPESEGSLADVQGNRGDVPEQMTILGLGSLERRASANTRSRHSSRCYVSLRASTAVGWTRYFRRARLSHSLPPQSILRAIRPWTTGEPIQ